MIIQLPDVGFITFWHSWAKNRQKPQLFLAQSCNLLTLQAPKALRQKRTLQYHYLHKLKHKLEIKNTVGHSSVRQLSE